MLSNRRICEKNRAFELWHYILPAAVIGLLPMTGILLLVISASVNKNINNANIIKNP